MYLTVKQVASMLQVREETVRSWIKYGELAYIRLGRSIRIADSDLNAFLEERKRKVGRNEQESR